MDISICMGSACYMKGARVITEVLKENLHKKNLDNKVFLKGSFCLGPCKDGVAIRVGEKLFCNLNPMNVKEKLESEIFPYILENLE